MSAEPSLESYDGARALVLGGSGFIGRWVARQLAHRGADVYLVVRRQDAGGAIAGSMVRRPRVVEVDLLEPGAIEDLVGDVSPDITFNLAGYGVDHEEREEHLYVRVNVEIPTRLCERLASLPSTGWKGQRLVHTGSALEYGESKGDLTEDSRPVPTTIYGETKLLGTRALVHWRRQRSLPALTARLFTVYGKGEHSGRLLPSLIKASTGSGLIPLTDGRQERDFTYVEDVAEGLLRLGVSSAAVEVVNLATGRLTAVRDFVRTAARILDIPSERLGFGTLPTRAKEMQHLPVNVHRLRTTFGWVPETEIGEGVRRTLSHMT